MLKRTTGSEYLHRSCVTHKRISQTPRNFFFVRPSRYNKAPSNSSPPRPSTLPISEPKPVPSTRKLSRPHSPKVSTALIALQPRFNFFSLFDYGINSLRLSFVASECDDCAQRHSPIAADKHEAVESSQQQQLQPGHQLDFAAECAVCDRHATLSLVGQSQAIDIGRRHATRATVHVADFALGHHQLPSVAVGAATIWHDRWHRMRTGQAADALEPDLAGDQQQPAHRNARIHST
jgi:hypothetical protein